MRVTTYRQVIISTYSDAISSCFGALWWLNEFNLDLLTIDYVDVIGSQ